MGQRLERTNKEYGMDTLSELGIKYGTDKIGKHNYLPVYYDLFKDRRNSVEKVLEIGIAEGAGLFMFRDFFPKATIYGADNVPQRVVNLSGLDRIQPYLVDQSNELQLRELIKQTGEDIDLVVDDGSHVPEHQFFTFHALSPYLDEDVTYVIEDVSDPSIFDRIERLPGGWKCEMVVVGKRYDDRLIICQK